MLNKFDEHILLVDRIRNSTHCVIDKIDHLIPFFNHFEALNYL